VAPSHAGQSAAAATLRREMHLLLRQTSHDYERMQYNTVVSGAMKMLNAIDDAKLANTPADSAALAEALNLLLRTLYPVAPHISHGLWTALGFAAAGGDITHAPWPQVDEAALVQDELDLVLQVNGKMRGSIRIASGASNATIEALARAAPEVARFGEGRPVKMVKVVPGRLVNVVC
jgi:leucyl-tRNA synthetase